MILVIYLTERERKRGRNRFILRKWLMQLWQLVKQKSIEQASRLDPSIGFPCFSL